MLAHMLDPNTLISRLGGLARGIQLQRYGVSRPRLAHDVRAGRIERLRPGLFATTDLHPDERCAAQHGGALTCAAALRRHGVWVLSTGRPHVWVGRRGRTYEHAGCHCVSHYFHGIPPLGSVTIETALIHLHRCEGDESFFASFESAWRLHKLDAAARMRIRAALPASARWLVDFARPDADSGLESLVRLRLHLIGLLVECQVVLAGVGRVDFVIGSRLLLEIDGRDNHDGPSHRHKDLRRDAAASALGYETLRFDYAQVIHDWPAVQAAVLAALIRMSA